MRNGYKKKKKKNNPLIAVGIKVFCKELLSQFKLKESEFFFLSIAVVIQA